MTFSSKSILKNHVDRVHLKVNRRKGKQCKMVFCTKQDLKKQVESQHLKEHSDKIELNIKSRKGKQCKMALHQKSDLNACVDRKHLKVEPKEKLLCTECEATFGLKRHLENT